MDSLNGRSFPPQAKHSLRDLNLRVTNLRPRSPGSRKSSLKKKSITNELLNKSSRFDNKNSLRKEPNFENKLLESHLGPGSYDIKEIDSKFTGFKSLKTKFNKSYVPLQSTYLASPIAPPPGSYNLTRLMDIPPSTSDSSRPNTASFKSSGRVSELSADANSYQTLRNDVYMCNIGPGFYDVRDGFDKVRAKSPNNRLSLSRGGGDPICNHGAKASGHACQSCLDKSNWKDAFNDKVSKGGRVRPVTSYQILTLDSSSRPSTSGGVSTSSSYLDSNSSYSANFGSTSNNNLSKSSAASCNQKSASWTLLGNSKQDSLARNTDIESVKNLPSYK